MNRHHLNRGDSRFEPLVAGLDAGAVERLLQGLAGQYPERVRHSGLLLRLSDPAGDFVVNGLIVRGLAANQAAEGDDGVVLFRLGENSGGGRHLPSSGNANNLNIRLSRAAAVEAVEGAFEQPVGDDRVPAGDHDGETHSRRREIAFDGDRLAAQRFPPLPEGKDLSGNRFDGERPGFPAGVGDLRKRRAGCVRRQPAFGDFIDSIEATHFNQNAGRYEVSGVLRKIDEFQIANRGKKWRSTAGIELPTVARFKTESGKEAG